MISYRSFAFILAMLGVVPAFAAANLPLVEDFELTPGGFAPSSAASWKWGPPAAGPGAAHSRTQVWGTNLTSVAYSDSEDAILTSQDYDLTAIAGKAVVVHWWQWLVTEEGYDPASVEVSRDGGGTWEAILGPRSGAVNTAWTQHTVVLDSSYATASFRIRFRLISDDFPSEGGFFIDDLRLGAATLLPAAPLQDFELGDGGYVASGTNSSWAYGTPVSRPGSAFSGANVWATNLDGLYHANEDSALTSPTIDLSGSAGKLLVVSWKQFFDTEEDYDFGFVEVSKDNGATWTRPAGETLSGLVSPGWMRQQVFLDSSFATAGFRLRFRLTSDESYQFDGWAIDDVAIVATSELFPTTASFTKATPKNTPAIFSKADFTGRFSDPDGSELTSITITQLPVHGTLQLGADPVVVNQTIPLDALATLRYVPETDASGIESFQWTAGNFFGPSLPGTVSVDVVEPTPQVVITSDPESQTVNPGSPVTFSVTAVSSLSMAYQWRKNFQNIDNATGPTYSIPVVAETDENVYDVVVNNTATTATSAAASLSVNDPVKFIDQPLSTFVNEGGAVTFAVSAEGTGRLDYQWTKDGHPIPDETFSTLKIEDATAADEGAYRCEVTNVVGTKTTDPANLAVRLKPRFVAHPISRGVLLDGRVTFEVQVDGFGPFTYQWLKDGEEIPGATGPKLILTKLLQSNAGSYSVRVDNGVAEAESDPAKLQVFVWDDVKGVYQDVLAQLEPAGIDQPPFPGRLTVTVTSRGKFTGALQYRGLKYSIRGTFDTTLTASRTIKRPLQSALKLDLLLNPDAQTLTASLTHDDSGVAFRSEGLLPRQVYDRKTNPAPQRGYYTMLLQPAGAGGAPGYLTATALGDGRMQMLGRLPDGRLVSSGAYVQTTGRIAMYQQLYPANATRAGEFAGRVTLPGAGEEEVRDSELSWRKPQQASASDLLPGPFVVSIEATGSRYRVPDVNQTVVELPQDEDLLDLHLVGLPPGPELRRWVRLTPENQFLADPTSAEKIQINLRRKNGFVSGGYTDPATRLRYQFRGVSLQSQKMFGGMLVQKLFRGSFTMFPLVQ